MGEKGVWDLLDVWKRCLMLCGKWMRGRNGWSRGTQPGGGFPPAGGRGDLEQAGGSGGAGTRVKRCSGSKTDGWCRKVGKMMLDFQPGTAVCGGHCAGTGSGEECGVEGAGLDIVSMRCPRGRGMDGRPRREPWARAPQASNAALACIC